ncbi:MAG: hypothetical protein IJR89_02750, partial [Clostridia bacterium]|nr:hypothetical protein [Clostridia bacterium]
PAGTVAAPETDAETAAAPELPALAFFADMGARTFEPLSSYSASWIKDKDILCLGVKPEGTEGTSYQALWGAAFAAYPDLARYRLGFLVSFTLADGRRFDLTVLSPADTEGAFTDYLDIYLYDDYHQTPGVWYSHVEKNAYTAETTLTSIKLTGREKIAEVREIVLSAVFYTEDDLDEEGRFTGLPALTLPIGKEN